MLAIHHRAGSFSDYWIKYCSNKGLSYKVVNCFDSDIIEQLSDCQALMWHWSHNDPKAALFARQLTYALEMMGKKVFPSFNTCWHFDDKVGQKYLFEANNVPCVPSFVFYDKDAALKWLNSTDYPVVFKLRGGAGSENVKLVYNYKSAAKLVKKAFRKGFKVKSRMNFLKERIWHFNRDRSIRSFFAISKGLARLIVPTAAEKSFDVQKNYVYFQEFIPNNDSDIRVIVIENKAFAIKRVVREGDFRASGSGKIIYDVDQIPLNCVKLSFEISESIKSQCVAIDYVFKDDLPLLVEISYSFSKEGYLPCPGYWDRELQWYPGEFYPEEFMITSFISQIS